MSQVHPQNFAQAAKVQTELSRKKQTSTPRLRNPIAKPIPPMSQEHYVLDHPPTTRHSHAAGMDGQWNSFGAGHRGIEYSRSWYPPHMMSSDNFAVPSVNTLPSGTGAMGLLGDEQLEEELDEQVVMEGMTDRSRLGDENHNGEVDEGDRSNRQLSFTTRVQTLPPRRNSTLSGTFVENLLHASERIREREKGRDHAEPEDVAEDEVQVVHPAISAPTSPRRKCIRRQDHFQPLTSENNHRADAAMTEATDSSLFDGRKRIKADGLRAVVAERAYTEGIDDTTYDLLMTYLRTRLWTEDPWATNQTINRWLDVWCKNRGLSIFLKKERRAIVDLLTKNRSAYISSCRRRVPDVYNLEGSAQRIRNRVNSFLDQNRYLYEKVNNESGCKTGGFRAFMLKDQIATFYQRGSLADLARKLPEADLKDPFQHQQRMVPTVLIAFTANAIEKGFEDWKDGIGPGRSLPPMRCTWGKRCTTLKKKLDERKDVKTIRRDLYEFAVKKGRLHLDEEGEEDWEAHYTMESDGVEGSEED